MYKPMEELIDDLSIFPILLELAGGLSLSENVEDLAEEKGEEVEEVIQTYLASLG